MKCEIISFNYNSSYRIVVEINKVYIEDMEERQVLDIDSKTCFNTLVSLFSLKEKWVKKEIYTPLYKVIFEQNRKVEIFEFGIDVPENWDFFIAYIRKLVGEFL